VPFDLTARLVKLTIDLGPTTVTPQALEDLQRLMAATQTPIVGGFIADLEGFIKQMQQGNGP
jgi:hypothetical protein